MYIKNVSYEPVETGGNYTRKVEPAPEQAQKVQPQTVQRELNRDEVSEVVDRLNNGVRDIHERMAFSYNEKTQRIVVRVMDNETNEVVREIPSKEAMKLLEHIQDFLGMLVDESR
jgi:flagellar protein FlaG